MEKRYKHFVYSALFMLTFFLGLSQGTKFKKHAHYGFTVELPEEMRLRKMFDEVSPEASLDYGDYEVIFKDKDIRIEFHSLIVSRYGCLNVQECYDMALNESNLEITYKYLGENYFVISGINKNNGNIYYWKSLVPDDPFYIHDMVIEYNEKRKSYIEKYIGRISKSFQEDSD